MSITPKSRRLRTANLLALAALTLAVLAVYARVLFTPLIPASGDFLAYFAPYWDQLNQALRAGHLPLWNDYIFAGAPFQANPQTQVFYPLRWPMILFSAGKGILITAALHAWLAGVFGYFLIKKLLGTTEATQAALPSLIAALLLSLNGWVTGLLLHPNQISAYPWLLAAILLWEKRPRPGQWPRWDQATRRWGITMTLFWAMAFLAGHTQSFYNAAVIFGLWILGDILWRNRGLHSLRLRHLARSLADAWPVALATLLLAGLVAAVQLLPTLELSQLSYRQGGLAFREHAALSLPPWRLGFTLLPHYARDLGMALGTDAYGEWMAYAGVAGLILALLGLRHPNRRLRFLGVFLTLAGLLLAFGAYDPLEYLFYRLIPGWNLFRVPARFLPAAILGIALLAALGAQELKQRAEGKAEGEKEKKWIIAGAIALGGLALLTRPNLITTLGWAAAAAPFALILWPKRPIPSLRRLIPLILFLELYFASYALPIQHPTAPQALQSWRTAPARIAAELGPGPRGSACRTVSLSTTTWDPGDLHDLQRIYAPYLDEKALTDLINATKAKEVIAPNLGVILHIPSLDGFGGGVLPTARFVKAMALFLPPENIVADGRLREQLHAIPSARLLAPFNVCYVIADKNFDAWHDDIYYDLAFGAWLTAAQPDLTITDAPQFPASGVGLISHLSPQAASLPQGEPVATITTTFYDNSIVTLPIRAGIETAVGADESRPPKKNDLPAVRWPYNAPGQDIIAELDIPAKALPASLSQRRIKTITFHLLRNDAPLFIRGIAIYDRASGSHATPIVTRDPWRRIHSGDVKIYRNDAALPRLFTVDKIHTVANLDEAVTVMQAPDFDPAHVAVLEESSAVLAPQGIPLSSPRLQILERRPERLHLHYRADGDALLIVAEGWHPGWRAVLDPDADKRRELPIFPADIFLRGVSLPAGEHDLIITFQPRSLRLGALLSLLTLAGLAILWLLPARKD